MMVHLVRGPAAMGLMMVMASIAVAGAVAVTGIMMGEQG
jgi:hypothetical protein